MTLRGGWNPTWIFCGTWWSRRWVTFVLIIKMPRYSEPKCKLIEVQNWMCEKYGILEASITFTYSLMVVNYHIPGILDLKLKHLASFGLPQDELKKPIRKRSVLLNSFMDKMQKILAFLIHTAGLPPYIVGNVWDTSSSIRIKPHKKVFNSVSAVQPYKCLSCLTSLVALIKNKLLDKYVNCSPYLTYPTPSLIYWGFRVLLETTKLQPNLSLWCHICKLIVLIPFLCKF